MNRHRSQTIKDGKNILPLPPEPTVIDVLIILAINSPISRPRQEGIRVSVYKELTI